MILITILCSIIGILSLLYYLQSRTLQDRTVALSDARSKFTNLKISYNEILQENERIKGERNITQQALELLEVDYNKLKTDHQIVLDSLKKYGWTAPKRGVTIITKQPDIIRELPS